MKILVVITESKMDGVTYHRLSIPFNKLADEGHDITSVDNIDNISVGQLMQFDVVVMSRCGLSLDAFKNIHKIRECGVKLVYDVDDYWHLDKSHLMEKQWRTENIPMLVTHFIHSADVVWTTHKDFAELIGKYNKNVEVIPNAIDTAQPQWYQNEPRISDKYTFGWVGGIHHEVDLNMLQPALNRIHELDCNIALGGYKQGEPQWQKFERMFNQNNPDKYMRIEARDVFNYAHIYDQIDFCLIPLKANKFNRCKSELKVLEAAVKMKPVIVSAVTPYLNICNENNSYLIEERQGHKAWFKAIEKVLSNPYEAADKAIQMRKDVHELYNLETINNKRIESIKSLL